MQGRLSLRCRSVPSGPHHLMQIILHCHFRAKTAAATNPLWFHDTPPVRRTYRYHTPGPSSLAGGRSERRCRMTSGTAAKVLDLCTPDPVANHTVFDSPLGKQDTSPNPGRFTLFPSLRNLQGAYRVGQRLSAGLLEFRPGRLLDRPHVFQVRNGSPHPSRPR